MWIYFLFLAGAFALPAKDAYEVDNESSRKILGSSVVTSVSVIMDTGNGSKAVFSDAVGKPVSKPMAGSEVASPIDLLNPDRYEFYTFDDSGDLVKRLMTLEEIQGIVATGDSGFDMDSVGVDYTPEKRVNDIVNNVQNVLKEEMEIHKDTIDTKPLFDTPDVSDSWSMILPAIFGNSGEDIKPEKPQAHVTPDTIMIEPTTRPIKSSTMTKPFQSSTIINNIVYPSSVSSPPRSVTTVRSTTLSSQGSSKITPNLYSTTAQMSTTEKLVSAPGIPNPNINVEIYSHSHSTTERNMLTPIDAIEVSKENSRPENNLEVSRLPYITKLPSTTKTPSTTKIPSTTKTPPTTKTSSAIQTSSTTKIPFTTKIMTIASSTTKVPSTSNYPSSTLMTTQSNVATKLPLSTTVKLPTLIPFSTYDPKVASTQITSSKPMTSESSLPTDVIQNSLPTLTDLLQIKNPEPSPTTISSIKKMSEATTVTQEESTAELTTFSYVTSNRDIPTTTKSKDEKPTYNPPTLDELLQSLQQKTAISDDLNTLASEYIKPNKNFSTTESSLTTLPIIYLTTASLPSTVKEEKITTTSALDKLLLTYTNIYEINNELLEKATTTEQEFDKESESQYFTTKQEQPTTEEITETSPDDYTKPTVINLNDPTKQTTTNENLISSIEQLLSQAVGQIKDTVVTKNEHVIVENLLNDTANKTMEEVQKETATAASTLMESSEDIQTPTEQNLLNDIASANTNLLSGSVGSLLSQVYGVNNPSFTTLSDLATDKYPTTNFNRKTEDSTDMFYLKTTEATNTEVTTEMPEKVTDKYEEIEIFEQTTIEYVTELLNKNKLETEDTYEPHLINITIIGAEKKPGKLDTSLEEEYFKEKLKNETESISVTTEVVPEPTTNVATTEKREDPTTIYFNIVDTTIDMTTEQATTVEDIIPSVVVTINEKANKTLEANNVKHETLSTIVNNKIQTTMLPVDEYTSSPISTLKFTTEMDATKSIAQTQIEIMNQKITENIISTTILPKITINEEPGDKNKQSWTLVPTISPHSEKPNKSRNSTTSHPITAIVEPPVPVDLIPKPLQGFGLEDSTSTLDTDIYQFVQLCNELAFGLWKSVTSSISTARSVVVSPFAASSLLAMVFLGARGATSGEMNEILKLDDMVTFNPHLIFKNITESIHSTPESGVAISAIVRELYSDKSKGPILGFYKERAKQFYDGHIEEVSFKEIGDVIRRRTNLLVKKYSKGKIAEYLKDASIIVKSPLAGVSINIFQTDCSHASTEGRDGELHFVVLPSIRQRRLIPIPAILYRSGFLAGYEPSLDATAVALGTKDQVVSTIFIIPGQQGIAAPGDGLARLEKRLVESSFKKGAWSRLLRALIPRPGLEVQIPRFSHRSVVNATWALKKMGLKDLFNPLKADLKGLNGVAHELHFSEMIQINNFATCGEERIGETHHSEIYPATPSSARSARYMEFTDQMDFLEEPRDYQRAFHDPLHDPTYLSLPLSQRPRQARIPEIPRLRFDRPFLYVVRHNPTGLILHMGRFNPRLLP